MVTIDVAATCPACGSRKNSAFLTRQRVPVHQNLICRSERSAIDLPRGDLTLNVCSRCGFVFNSTFRPELLSYSADYDNTQTCSDVFQQYLSELVSMMIHEKGIVNSRIIDVGCGKGYFLRKLIEGGEGNTGIGFDPSYVGDLRCLDDRLRFDQRFYDRSCADYKADVVVCRHVIEHVSDPLDMLRSIHEALSGSPDSRVFFETPCVDWILNNGVVWDFFYEHCSLFTKSSITSTFQAAGFEVLDVRNIFGGQYLWLEAKRSDRAVPASYSPGSTVSLAQSYRTNEDLLVRQWQDRLMDANAEGPTAIWGAGAKGVTFLNLIDPDRKKIDCVIDINPNKQGGYLPGTGHKIVGIDAIKERGIKSIILMNPNYYNENRALLDNLGITIKWL
jgi:2-polyprenyl-3-methyl-5-hydroxy-6-metoxy-1,4-benzoquinol methylase